MFPVPLLNQAWIASSRSILTNAKVFVAVHLLQQLPGCKGDNEGSKHREFNWPSTISLLLEDPVNAIKIKTNHIKLQSFDKKTLVKGNSFSPLRQVDLFLQKTPPQTRQALQRARCQFYATLCNFFPTRCTTQNTLRSRKIVCSRNTAAHAQTRISFPRKSLFCVKTEE